MVGERRSGARRGAARSGLGAHDQVGHGGSWCAAPAATAIGWQTPAGQVLRRRWSSSSDTEVSHRARERQGRQALVVAQGRWPRCRGRGRRAARGRSAWAVRRSTRSPISYRRRRPMRHGIVLPHASSAQKRVSSRPRSTTQARSSATRRSPSPTWAPASRSASKSYGGVEPLRRQAARRSDRRRGRALSGRPAGPAGERRRARGAGSRAGPRRCPPPSGRGAGRARVPGARRAPIAANAGAPVAQDPGHGGQRLDVVDHGRLAEQAPLGRVRRPLLGLPALALERLEQDGLLAQHVGALDGPDGHRRSGGPSRARRRPGSRPPRPRARHPRGG